MTPCEANVTVIKITLVAIFQQQEEVMDIGVRDTKAIADFLGESQAQ